MCYLTKRFPRLSETFILDEILGLEALGIPLRLFAIADPHERIVQPDVARVGSPVGYLRTGGGAWSRARDLARALGGHTRLARRRPRRWAAVVGHVLVARPHRSTLRHLLEAGVMATELQRSGGVHLHAAFANGPASVAHLVALLTGTPFSFAAHAKDLYLSSPDILAVKVAAAEFVLACSQSAAEELRRIVAGHHEPAVRASADKVVLAPHGVDVERFRPAPAGRPPGPVSVVAVGRLVPKKGYPVLLEALEALAGSGAEFSCRVVGDGELRGLVEARLAATGLSGRVSLLGRRTQREIVDEYRSADVFVQASVITPDGDRDGIPNAVLEAMASGLPVVATSVAGIPEVVHHGVTGLLVPPGDAAALAAALGTLIADDPLRARLGAAGRALVESSWSRTACVAAVARRLMPVTPAGPPVAAFGSSSPGTRPRPAAAREAASWSA